MGHQVLEFIYAGTIALVIRRDPDLTRVPVPIHAVLVVLVISDHCFTVVVVEEDSIFLLDCHLLGLRSG